MADDVLLNKVAVIERCLARVASEYQGRQEELDTNFTRQDSIILNLQRACEASIDAAMHLVRIKKLGIPQESREVFDMLREAGIITASLCERLKANGRFSEYRRTRLPKVEFGGGQKYP